MNKKVVKEDKISTDTRDNRAKAQALLDQVKRKNRKRKFVRVPITGGYLEVEESKYRKQLTEKKR